MTTRGNPLIAVRVEPEFMEQVHSAFPKVKGRSGGSSLALRKLLHLALDTPMPKQFGEVGRSKAVDELEEHLREIERQPFDSETEALLRLKARKLLTKAADSVDVLRLRALLGRLHLWETPLIEHDKS